MFVWKGRGANADERAVALNVARILKVRSLVVFVCCVCFFGSIYVFPFSVCYRANDNCSKLMKARKMTLSGELWGVRAHTQTQKSLEILCMNLVCSTAQPQKALHFRCVARLVVCFLFACCIVFLIEMLN